MALTTSFGTANLYLDYWLFDSSTKKFIFVGNFSQFKIDKKNKTLTSIEKQNAARYVTKVFQWKGVTLHEITEKSKSSK